jgi:hypothetical protein
MRNRYAVPHRPKENLFTWIARSPRETSYRGTSPTAQPTERKTKMETAQIIAIDNFIQAVTALKIDKDGIEGSSTEAIEAVLLSLRDAAQTVADNPDWEQAVALKRAINATAALTTTLNVISDQNTEFVTEWALAWGAWIESRQAAAARYINETRRRGDPSNN